MRIILLLIFILGVTAADCAASPPENEEFQAINIMAASSLTEVMTEIIREYSAKNGVSIAAVYDSPPELERRRKDGERADIFISESSHWMNDLRQAKLIDAKSIAPIAGNQLAVVEPSGHAVKSLAKKQPVENLLDNLSARLFVMADYNNDPLGIYSKMALDDIGLFEKAKENIIRASDSVDAVYLISTENVPGIVYYSDAWHNPDLQILAVLPEKFYEPVIYNAALAEGENMPQAQGFLGFLKSPESRKLFEKYGFSAASQ